MTDFYTRYSSAKRQYGCKACRSAQAKIHNSNPVVKARTRARMMDRKYGLRLEQEQQLVQMQDGRCALCKHPPGGQGWRGKLCVDHDHFAGFVRGMLCADCNIALGHYEKILQIPGLKDYLSPKRISNLQKALSLVPPENLPYLEHNWTRKLTKDEVLDIYHSVDGQKEIARKYGLGFHTVGKIQTGNHSYSKDLGPRVSRVHWRKRKAPDHEPIGKVQIQSAKAIEALGGTVTARQIQDYNESIGVWGPATKTYGRAHASLAKLCLRSFAVCIGHRPRQYSLTEIGKQQLLREHSRRNLTGTVSISPKGLKAQVQFT